MSNPKAQSKAMSYVRGRCPLALGALFVVLFTTLVLWAFTSTRLHFPPALVTKSTIMIAPESKAKLDCDPGGEEVAGMPLDPTEETFYDDPNLSYSVGTQIYDWDTKRLHWLKHHQSFAAGVGDRVILVTGSQPFKCASTDGDHLLLRLFKNKVDYSRIHGYDIAIPELPMVYGFHGRMGQHGSTESEL